MRKPLGRLQKPVAAPLLCAAILFLLTPPTLCRAQSCPNLAITSVTPDIWFAGKSYTATIEGTGFDHKITCLAVPVITAADGTSVPYSGFKVKGATTMIVTGVLPPASDPTETACVTPGGVSVLAVPARPIALDSAAANAGAASAAAPAPGTAGSTCKDQNGLHGITVQILGNQIHCDPSMTSMNCTQTVISTADGSMPPTQTVVAGQTISLITNPDLPATIKPTKTTWTLTDGMNIGGYIFGPPASNGSPSTAKVKETVLDKPSLTTYWLYPNSSVPVTYQYCVDIPGADPVHQCSPEANAIFNVTGPTADITPYQGSSPSSYLTWGWSVSTGFPGCSDNPKGLTQFLSFGEYNPPPATCNPTVEFPGIVFAATDVNLEGVTAPNGQFWWVQLLTGGQVAGTLKSGGAAPPILLGDGLDNFFPVSILTTAQDSPGTGLLNNWANATKTFSAEMYLLWYSGLDSAAVPVPIGYETWSIHGNAYDTTASPPWMLGPDSVSSPATTNYTASTAQQPSYGMPIWTKVSLNHKKSINESESNETDGEQENQQ